MSISHFTLNLTHSAMSGLCDIIMNQPCGLALWTGRCKKLPEEGGDSVLHLLGDRRADGEAEAEGDQVDVGAQLVAQPPHLVYQSGLDVHCTCV